MDFMEQLVQVISHDLGERYRTETHFFYWWGGGGGGGIIFAFICIPYFTLLLLAIFLTNLCSSKFQQI